MTILLANVEWMESNQVLLYCSRYKDARCQLFEAVTEVLAAVFYHTLLTFSHKRGTFALSSLQQRTCHAGCRFEILAALFLFIAVTQRKLLVISVVKEPYPVVLLLCDLQ